ncbi:hypothetical protein H6F67_15820 [Microcoleus sp. FACHB-1515]|uniref:hypothetical protein n=1 Tax=Cyanophyceae TaxID=3028117 RepID=UPI001689B64D|nr:hypothetical protein [Microcoleus sp. FACHB-1515]MBD2091314.1 hypothetical protein [Microcoleus sp. FACHB-1515]
MLLSMRQDPMLEYPDPIQAQSLEAWVRTAIAFGELSPAAEAHLNHIVAEGVSEVERRLLALLNDAIQAGCVRRVYPSWG